MIYAKCSTCAAMVENWRELFGKLVAGAERLTGLSEQRNGPACASLKRLSLESSGEFSSEAQDKG